jgi:glycosyltransferase involved in cell wall biosynthesis
MPVYNAEEFLEQAIRSVLNQTYGNIEFVIVNDFSGDSSGEIIRSFAEADARIKAIDNKKNEGCAESRNIALKSCSGEYIAFIDSDDVWIEDKLEKQIKLLESSRADLAYCAYDIIDYKGDVIGNKSVPEYTELDDLLKENYIAFSSVCCLRSCTRENSFTGEFFHTEDYVFLLNLLKKNKKLCGLNSNLVQYRRHAKNISSNKLKTALYRWRIYRRHLRLGLCEASLYFAHYALNGFLKYRKIGFVAQAGPLSVRGVVAKLLRQYVTSQDRVLLDTVFAEKPTQAQLDECLRVCDIEVMGAHKSLMLSYLMREHPELKFSAYAAPRLQGLITFYRFANIRTLQHFSKIGKALNAAGIIPAIFKGAAMKLLRPELSRPMGDVDILLAPERLAEAARICESLGYRDAMTGSPHAVDIQTQEGEGAVDIHSALFNTDFTGGKVSPAFQRALLARAREGNAFGVRVLLPAHEDLFFIVLVNFMKNLREKTSLHGLFYALCDCRFLLADKPSFDWGIVRENARLTGEGLQARMAVEFMNALVPGFIPEAKRALPLTREMENFCNRLIFDEDHFSSLLRDCRLIRVADLKNYPRHYGGMILKFLALKRLRRIPAFVRWYLRRHGRPAGEAWNAR